MNTIKKTSIRIISMVLYGIIFSVTSILSGCGESFLYKEPKGVVFYENLANKEGIEYLTIAAYSILTGATSSGDQNRAGAASSRNWAWNCASDDVYKGTTFSDTYDVGLIERYDTDPTNMWINNKWLVSYDGISRANDVLRTVATARENNLIDEEFALQSEAQAKFLRGWWHFRLLKVFWQIPYITEDVTPQEVKNDHKVWPEIEGDLQFAIDNLPEEWPGQPGRATKWAAMAYKAYVFLYQHKYSEAKVLLDEIINSNRFRLVDNFGDNFSAHTENNVESIFEIQHAVNYPGSDNNPRMGNADSWVTNGQNLGVLPTCCGLYQPSQDLVNAFKVDANGLPLLGFNGPKFNDEDLKNDMGILSSEEFHPTDHLLDPRLDWTVGRRGIPYLDWGIMTGNDFIRSQENGGPYLGKKSMYLKADKGVVSHSSYARAHSINNPKVRYGHILLWRAECAVEENDLEKARELVNMLRRRASDDIIMGKCLEYTFSLATHPSIEIDWTKPAANYKLGEYPSFPNQEYAREAVRMEMRLEFAMEGNRFFDLVRWGIDYDVLTKFIENDVRYGRSFMKDVTYTKEKNSRWPIPQSQLDNQKGVLEQDPLW